MLSILLALSLTATHPACYGDGHNQRRNKRILKKFARQHPCPPRCALFKKDVAGNFVVYQKCGACQIDHICPLACCGQDDVTNLQWLPAEKNRQKGADCSACR